MAKNCKQYLSETQGNQIPILVNLEQAFLQNKYQFSSKSQDTFWHEFGHCFEAIKLGYNFVLIIVPERFRSTIHVFYPCSKKIIGAFTGQVLNTSISSDGDIVSGQLKDQVRYLSFDDPAPHSRNGIAFFDSESPRVDEYRQIAFGGIIQDLHRQCKTLSKCRKNFGVKKISNYRRGNQHLGDDSFWAFFATQCDVSNYSKRSHDINSKIIKASDPKEIIRLVKSIPR